MIDEAMPLPGLGAPAAATVSTIRPMPNAQNTTRPGDFSLPGLSAAMPAPTLPPPSSMQMQMPPLPGMPQPTMMQPQQQQMAPSALPDEPDAQYAIWDATSKSIIWTRSWSDAKAEQPQRSASWFHASTSRSGNRCWAKRRPVTESGTDVAADRI
jgi:hypothetical protein